MASWTSADVWAQPAPPPPETVGVAASFEQLRVIAGPDAMVTVTDATGTRLTGRIPELSASSLSIIANGQRHDFGEGDIASIRQRRGDPLGNGALWGAGITAGLAALAVGAAAADCDCDASPGAWLWIVGANAVFGAGAREQRKAICTLEDPHRVRAELCALFEIEPELAAA